MKYTTIKEHHLYDKAFRRGERFGGKYVTCFVLRDYAAKRLMLAHPQKAADPMLVTLSGIVMSVKLEHP